MSETNKLTVLALSRPAPGILSDNQILVFFDLKYLWNSFVFDFVFLDVGRHSQSPSLWNRYAQPCWDQAKLRAAVGKFNTF